jgi:hypothetical protein
MMRVEHIIHHYKATFIIQEEISGQAWREDLLLV